MGLVAVGCAVGGTLWFTLWGSLTTQNSNILTGIVKRANFQYLVTDNGEVESSSNVEVRCEVQSRTAGVGSSSTTILEIIPEGSYVEAGDFICRLDSSPLRDELTHQQIIVNTSQAAKTQAESNLRTAEIAREEYLKGTFKQEEQTIQGEISVAEENLRKSRDYAEHSKKLFVKGYVTALQLEGDLFAVQKAEMDLETGQTKLEVLRSYTKPKMLSQLEADIEIAKANLASADSTLALDIDKQELIEEQIKKCEIHAPAAGQVVYANESDRRGNSEVVIEEGAAVRERQVIIRLPDPKRMQVDAKINESQVDRVLPGMPAIIRIDAFPGQDLRGTVIKVDEYPQPSGWLSTVKEYATKIAIDDPPQGIRPGMTAGVQVQVEFQRNVIQVPVQAVFEHGGMNYCIVQEGDKLIHREIKIASTNDRFVVVEEGLNENEHYLQNPRIHKDKVRLPEIPELEEEELIAAKGTGPDQQEVSQRSETGRKPEAEKSAAGQAAGPGGPDPAQFITQIMQRMDKNGDGKLSEDEFPENARSRFADGDKNNDGFIDVAEMTASMKAMRGQDGPGGADGGQRPSAGGGQ
jgi:multidrug resistance efflux pump